MKNCLICLFSGGKSKHYEPKRRNSSDMEMDDEEGEDCESSSTVQSKFLCLRITKVRALSVEATLHVFFLTHHDFP